MIPNSTDPKTQSAAGSGLGAARPRLFTQSLAMTISLIP
jgi:hypothetical protein